METARNLGSNGGYSALIFENGHADQATLPVLGFIGVGDTTEERMHSARLKFLEHNAALEQGNTFSPNTFSLKSVHIDLM